MGGAGGNYAWDTMDIKYARVYVIRERGGRRHGMTGTSRRCRRCALLPSPHTLVRCDPGMHASLPECN